MPNAAPTWCWIDPVDSTTIRVWWTDRSTDEDEWEIDRFGIHRSLFTGDNPKTWESVVTGLATVDKAGSSASWKSKGKQTSYDDTTASPDMVYYYRVRATETGGSNPTAWTESWHWCVTPPNDNEPALALDIISTKVPQPTGDIHNMDSVADLDTLLGGGTVDGKTLKRGDIIELDTTVDWTSDTFTFPKLTETLTGNRNQDFVLVRSKNWQQLPSPEERVKQGDTVNMPEFFSAVSGSGPIKIAKGASHYWFVGLYLRRRDGGTDSSVGLFECYSISDTDIQANERDAVNQHIVVDRCYISGSTNRLEGQGVGIDLFSDFGAVLNCTFRKLRQDISDGQCVLLFASYGPHLIQNNDFTTSCAQQMMSGSGGRAPGMTMADTIIRGNLLKLDPENNRNSIQQNFDFDNQATWNGIEIDASDATIVSLPGTATFTGLKRRAAIRIEPGVVGFTPGRYKVIGISPSTNPTDLQLDRPAGTVGSTGGTLTENRQSIVKELFEVKNGYRMLFENNIFEGLATDDQNAPVIGLGPRGASLPIDSEPNGYHHWTKAAHDFMFRWNYITNCEGCECFMQNDAGQEHSDPDTVSTQGRRVAMENTLWVNTCDSTQYFISISRSSDSTVGWGPFRFRHNTFHSWLKPSSTISTVTNPCRGVFSFPIISAHRPALVDGGQMIGNVFIQGTYGAAIISATTNFNGPQSALNEMADTGFEIRDNVWIDEESTSNAVPTGDTQVANYAAAFVDAPNGDFHVVGGLQGTVSPPVLRGQTDPGCDIDELNRRLQGVREGRKATQLVGLTA